MKAVISIVCLVVFLTTACKKNDEPVEAERKTFLVDKIYDYNNNLVATYEHDDRNRLIKRGGINSTSGYYLEYLFEYEGDKLSNIVYKDQSFPQFDHNIRLFYDAKGKIIKDETIQRGSIVGTRFYVYNAEGRINNIKYANGFENYFVDYSDKGNAVKVRELIRDDRTGELREQLRTFVYDDSKSVPFGIDDIFQIELLPQFGTEATFERYISANNMISFGNSGTEWKYTYNKEGLPVTIETKWKELPTAEPMMLRIRYKETK